MSRLLSPPREAIDAVMEEAERRLSPEEFRAREEAPMSDQEREESLSLIAWFTRRYPTPAERLAYAKRTERSLRRSIPRPRPGRG